MPDHQRVVNDVRAILRSGDQTLNDRMKVVAEDFQKVCEQGANRLQRCEEYVFQGRRTEAVQLAESSPPLLEVIAAINFPERAQWDELTAMYALPTAQTLLTPQAAAVNAAFAENQPLAPLLREHRRLALRRATAGQRLSVLRQLMQKDSANPVWAQQIEGLEGERAKDLRPELDTAVRKADVDAVLAIWTELAETPWLKPPTDLIESAQASIGYFQQQKAKANLDVICKQLQQAMKARDVAVAQDLRTRFEQESAKANLSPSDPLTSVAAKPLEWLADMETLLGNLQRHDLKPEDLEYQYRLLDRWHKLLPINLETQYENRIKEMAQAAKQKDWLILGFVLGGCAIITVLLVIWLVYVF